MQFQIVFTRAASWLGAAALVSFVACATAEPSAAGDATGADAATADDAARKNDSAPSEAGAADAGPACKLSKPYATKDQDCNACAEANCCAEVNACYADSDCDDGYVNCILACVLLPDDAGADASAADGGVKACTAACGTQYPKGQGEYDAISACVEASCTSECN